MRNLNSLRVDGTQVYRVRELILRRDAVRIALDEGKLAFLGALDGHVTGAVFTGEGRVIAVPRDPEEKSSLVRFLGAPLLDQSFSRAYFRFTDNSAEELRAQLTRAGAQPFAEASFAEDWNPTVANLNPQHSLRVLADLLAKDPQPYFFASIAGDVSGAFEVLVDDRRTEQIRVGQIRYVGGLPYFDTWTSFSRADQPAPAQPFEPLGYAVETTIALNRTLEGFTTARLQITRGGERAVAMEISRRLSVSGVTDDAGRALPFFETSDMTPGESALRGEKTVLVVLPEAPSAGQTIRLQLKYQGSLPSVGDPALVAGALGSWYARLAGSDKFVPFKLSFRWPRTLILTATAKKLEEREEGEWRTSKWASDGLIQSAEFSVSGIGWGDVNARGNYRDQWIQEGLANYLALMSEETKHPGALAAQLEGYRHKLVSPWGENEMLDSIGPLALGYRLHSSKSPRGSTQLIVPKASWAMHMLRMMLREPEPSRTETAGSAPAAKRPLAARTPETTRDPDERFTNLVHSLVTDYRHRALATADFQREVEKVMTLEMDLEGTRKTAGRPGAMDWFFDEWVRGTGIPRFSVEFDLKPAGERFRVLGKLKQSGVPASFIVSVPIYAARAAGGAPVLLGTVITSGAETTFHFTVRFAPKKLLIDPNLTLLCVTD